MSFLLYMMGRGLTRTAQQDAGIDALLARRGAGPLETSDAALAFAAELRQQTDLAGDLYAAALLDPAAPRWASQRAAALAALHGNFAGAATIYQPLARAGHARDGFIRGHLLLAAGDPRGAAAAFGETLAKFLADRPALAENDHPWPQEARMHTPDNGTIEIESLLDAGESLLKSGEFARARVTLEKALATVDLLMGGQAGWIVAETKAAGEDSPHVGPALAETLMPLVKMSDLLLRLLARTCLASSVADALRRRQLSDNVAVSAAGNPEINDLLSRERARIAAAAAEHPGHVEIHYHLGLLCRALGDFPAAISAFKRVLKISPYYTRAAVRLAVTLAQTGHPQDAPRILAGAFDVPADALARYYALALASGDPKKFDRAVSAMTHDVDPTAGMDIKANLAFALSEIGLLDDSHREWKESVSQPASL